MNQILDNMTTAKQNKTGTGRIIANKKGKMLKYKMCTIGVNRIKPRKDEDVRNCMGNDSDDTIIHTVIHAVSDAAIDATGDPVNIGTDDPVNHPSHYTRGGIECIDAIQSAITGLSGVEAWLTGSIIKYVWRQKHKNGVQDLQKARFYLNRLIKYYDDKKTEDPVQDCGCGNKRSCDSSQAKGGSEAKLPAMFGAPIVIRRVRIKGRKTKQQRE